MRQDLRKCAPHRTPKRYDVSDGSEERKRGKKIHVVGAITTFATKTVQVVEGKWSGKTITVLRSTGTSTVVVRTDLVREEEFTREAKPVYFMDGSMRELPVAEIEVETPYFSGSVTALCMERSMYDLILGNIDGVRDPDDPINLTAQEEAVASALQDTSRSTEVVQKVFVRKDERWCSLH
ncbi:hypothetical protein HPB48_010611 [Haemaphysalis longicornis]|uniref:Uncharacterized protein n=1 Tax=Haemaphysalis longicornis TaxID=44386 RepID=A0A9J6FS30_HAELO|nr:hypothetical protein HPB48_010611 [Haemaphysalis longicornis]